MTVIIIIIIINSSDRVPLYGFQVPPLATAAWLVTTSRTKEEDGR